MPNPHECLLNCRMRVTSARRSLRLLHRPPRLGVSLGCLGAKGDQADPILLSSFKANCFDLFFTSNSFFVELSAFLATRYLKPGAMCGRLPPSFTYHY